MIDNLIIPEELSDLARFSARIGADPLLIQASGGNTSVKQDGVMWIKASGTRLADAVSGDIFVPVDLQAILTGLDDPAVDADETAQFVLGENSLRPSIETSLHAVFEQRVVVHVHCVQTLAIAVRADAENILRERLAGFNWCLVPYVRPGANLSAEVRARLRHGTDVVVLKNHGLIVAAETITAAEALLDRVVAALTVIPAAVTRPDLDGLRKLVKAGWSVPDAGAPAHQLALDPIRITRAIGGSLYPDHVIFCGVGAAALEDDSLPDAADAPVMLIVRDKGIVMREDASSGAQALMRCLADVLMRVPPTAELNYLTRAQNAELLDWDAEKYRQALDA